MHPELEAALSHCRTLPSPPAIALRIIDLAQQPDADLDATARIIAQDSALSARMLRIANSPLYANRRQVATLGQALTLLGLNATLSLALGLSLSRSMRSTQPGDEQALLWRRSALAAMAARLLGEELGVTRPEELMLAGLLQDIGALALLQVRPELYRELLRAAADPGDRLRREREALGSDHAEIGAWIAARWNLPAYLQQAIGASESVAAGDSRFHDCVAASGLLADLWLADGDDSAHDARRRALAATRERLGLDLARFDLLVTRMADALPDIASLFDVHIVQPEHLDAIVEHARELLLLRNLQQLQDAMQARSEADGAAERVRQLEELALRDPLTGMYNRLQLENVLEREFEASVRLGQPLTLAFIDLDDFKRVNDRHGHLVGDQVLSEFARMLSRRLRSADLIARYGGEEFLVVLGNSGIDAASAVIRRILEEVARTPMAIVESIPLYVTFSAGLATHGEHERFGNARELLNAADQALYGAKRQGRNRVAPHGADPGA
ncbi:HDOD domain-containing protein [Luteimonas sp. SDU101]|uniref:GGDEF domain-containing protein n=1 Tax=unclassified Luteimonas TaxID=2629088 RepID=UPI003EC04BFE